MMNRESARRQIQTMLNLGPKSADWLIDAGVETPAQIAELGAVEVWKRTRELHPEFSLVGLYALQAALMDLHWRDLPEDIRADLRQQVGR